MLTFRRLLPQKYTEQLTADSKATQPRVTELAAAIFLGRADPDTLIQPFSPNESSRSFMHVNLSGDRAKTRSHFSPSWAPLDAFDLTDYVHNNAHSYLNKFDATVYVEYLLGHGHCDFEQTQRF
jgi:hypothetical protein